MIGASGIVGEHTTVFIPEELDASTPNPFWAFDANEQSVRNYAVVMAPNLLDGAGGNFPYPIGDQPLGGLDLTEVTLPSILYFTTLGFVSGSGDTPADQSMPPVLANPPVYSASIPLPGSFSAEATSSFGSLTLAIVGQELAEYGDMDDLLINRGWAGTEVDVYVGSEDLSFTDWGLYIRAELTQPESDEQYTTMEFKEPFSDLDVFIQRNEYDGEGDFGGDEGIVGLKKPFALGEFNYAPVPLINEESLVYQFHDGAGGIVDELHVGGVVATSEGDTSDILSAVITAGAYVTDLSRGLVRLATEPDGAVTVSGRGLGGLSMSSIIQYLVEREGVTANLTSFSANAAYRSGYWCGTDGIKVPELISELVSSIDGWALFNRLGQMTIGEHKSFSAADAVETLEHRDDGDRPQNIHNLRRELGNRPVWKYTVSHTKHFATGDADEDSTAEERQAYEQEWRKVTPATKSSTKARFKDADEKEINAYVNGEDAAVALRDFLITRDSVRSSVYTADYVGRPGAFDVGEVVLVYSDRFGLSAGQAGRILTIDPSEDGEFAEIRILFYGL